MENARSTKLAIGHYEINTEIEIDAPAAVVWSVLSDVQSYKTWAAFLVDIEGEINHGAEIKARFQLNPKKEKFNDIAHIISVQDGVEFFWAEKGPMGICDDHHFKVEDLGDNQCRFVQTDALRQGMTWLLGGMLSRIYVKGYVSFNKALKAEAERRFKAN